MNAKGDVQVTLQDFPGSKYSGQRNRGLQTGYFQQTSRGIKGPMQRIVPFHVRVPLSKINIFVFAAIHVGCKYSGPVRLSPCQSSLHFTKLYGRGVLRQSTYRCTDIHIMTRAFWGYNCEAKVPSARLALAEPVVVVTLFIVVMFRVFRCHP